MDTAVTDIPAFEPAPEDAEPTSRPLGRWLGLVLSLVGLAAVGFALVDPGSLGSAALYILGGFGALGLLVTAGLLAGLIRLDLRGRMLGERLAAGLAETAETAMAVTNDRGRLVYANTAFMTLAGGRKVRTAESALVGAGVADADEEDTSAARAFRLARAARAGQEAQEDISLTLTDGAARLITARVSPLPEALSPGTVGQSYALWRVTDRSASHEKLEASEREAGRLEAYLNGLVSGICALDEQGRVLYLNDTLAGWVGLDARSFTAGALEFDSLLAGPRVPLSKNADTADVRVYDADLKPRGGAVSTAPVVPARIVERAGEMPDGRKVTFLVLHDRRANGGGDLQDAAEVRFAHFFNNAPIGMATVDGDGRVVSVNRAFRDIAGSILPEGALSGDRDKAVTLSSLIAHEDRAAFDTAILDAAKGEPAKGPVDVRLLQPETGDKQANKRSADNEKVLQAYISRAGAAADAADGKPADGKATDGKAGGGKEGTPEEAARVMVYFVDMTEQKTLEVQFAQSQKMQAVGQLAGGVAHDFNNLLTAIIGFCDLLLVRHQPGDPSFADVMQIKQNANRAANLVRQLLAFSRQQTLRPTVLTPTDALADLSNLLRRLLGEMVELKMVHGRDLWTIKADQNQFEQVIINLAVNARDAMLEPDAEGNVGGTLTIRTANVSKEDAAALDHAIMPAADYVLIEVSDTGCGIAKENLGKIFEPFFSTKEVGKGTGLGLSTVYGIVKQTGGFIFPFSTLGKGTSFRIYIPQHIEAEKPKEEVAETAKKQADLSGKGTVLLVEDEDAVRSFAVRALETRGYTVLEAASGEHALDVVDEFDGELDVVVSDVVMPNMDGPTMVGELSKLKPGLKIIFISGYAEEAFKKNLDKDVEFQFLPKPFSLKQLAAKVKEVIESD
jgi:two-component system cell cycle sensor histidine kinase/response regulator CckA